MEDLALFSRHLAGAMATRAPLPEFLRAYLRDSEGGPVENAVAKIADDVAMGQPLAEAMDKHPKVFPAAYRRLVRLGEQGRTLVGMLRQTADRMEEGLKTYEHFRRAAAYPLILLLVMFGVTTFLTIVLRPKFEAIYMELGASLGASAPLGGNMATAILILNLILLVPIAYLLAALLGLRVWGFGSGRLLLQLPLIGPALRLVESANFANYLSLLLDNRVPLAESLGLISDASENRYVRAVVEDFRRRYESGEKLGAMMEHHPLFPASMAVMIAAAEDQGELAETLRHLGRFYHERTLHGLTLLREVMEPLMLILVGLFVALLVGVFFYMPLFHISKLIG